MSRPNPLEEFNDTKKILIEWFPKDYLMPVKKGLKHPAMPHNGGRWSWRKLDQWTANETDAFDACVLLQDLCVIDVDDEQMASELEAKFPILKEVPMEKTRRGRHYWFRRSEEADLLGYYDGHGQRQTGIDFKTRCRTGTGGIIVIAPSTGKVWEKDRKLNPDSLIPIPFDLLDAVSTPSHHMERKVFKFMNRDEPIETETIDLKTMSYFEPFLEGDVDGFTCDHIPVPCTEEEYRILMRVVNSTGSGWIPPLLADDWSTAILIGDKLGIMNIDLYEKLTRSMALWTHDIKAKWPEMASAIEFEYSYRRGEGDDNSVCLDVDKNVRELGAIMYAPILPQQPALPCMLWEHDETALFGRAGPSTRIAKGTVVVADDVIQRVNAGVPQVVQFLMQIFPLVLAGGYILGVVSNPEIIEKGHDCDLFVYGLDDDAADEMLFTISNEILPSRAWRLIQTPNAWTFIEQLTRDAPNDATPLVIQIILRLYLNPYEIPAGFDISAARIAAWVLPNGEMTVQACPSWFESMRRLMIPVEPVDKLFSRATSMRTVKYAGKGFDVMFPGMRKNLLSINDMDSDMRISDKLRKPKLLRGVRLLTYIDHRLRGYWPDKAKRVECLPKIIRSIRCSRSEYEDNEVKITSRFLHALASIPWACMNAVRGLFGGARFQGGSRGDESPENSDARLILWRKFGDRQPSAFKTERPCLGNLHSKDSRFELVACEALGIEPRRLYE